MCVCDSNGDNTRPNLELQGKGLCILKFDFVSIHKDLPEVPCVSMKDP